MPPGPHEPAGPGYWQLDRPGEVRVRNLRNARLLLAGACCAVAAATAGCGLAQQGQPSAAAAAHVSQQDRRWIGQAHTANMAEMDTGQLATLNGATPAVRSAGATLNRDHTAADAALVKLCDRLKIKLPTSETVRQTDAHDRLTEETGPRFDYDFTGTMLAAHQAMISATRWELSHGSSAQVIGLAKQTLPVLRKHLKLLQAAAQAG